ncbi:MAG TPA: xanthine dehydrogenase family protein molybdopterin-binding subunit [Acidimicrobiales bacterium]|jgi:carbon-monoxide dehydrogenase large subunit|nr:molybdopterin-dependent oxidoreductase [Actinomycetes bacterium]MCP4843594.1 molybdopterin-dependent oxidoreductase [Actinomycetes bacterium]MDP7352849.1 xanthine dehydrogenase family protein molybdopterin-binding subunit [Acidimicrobiales bacterium]HJM30800.1 xanthine dehydrogenase family protein molybdopterin-binding subunit [Acidimicrobiales bacterium]HJO20880.1 xanthine dehydrogenase family protein molybdopterin-binding subunit [Acidimicrobiales bacterium]|tara:strand:- start:1100 stop:3478 length:2379 start_codon:yes stop_codon:yes gene_type:complete
MTETPFTGGIVGESRLRREDPALLTGEAKFIDDLQIPGALWLACVRSPHAHARITAIDASAALGIDGVVAVYSGDDLADAWAAPLPCAWPVTDDMKNPAHHPVAQGKANYAGDIVAVVVAESRYAAADGLEGVVVDYEPLDAVVTIEDAESDRVVIHEDCGTNVSYEWPLVPDPDAVEAAFADAAHHVTETFVHQRLIPTAMEPRGVAAVPAPHNGDITLYSSTQIPHILKVMAAITLGLPEQKVRVIAPSVGGGFGCKLNVYAEEIICMALAQRHGVPVRWTEGRTEASGSTIQGRAQRQTIELAADADGKLTAVRATLLADMGAYLQLVAPGVPLLGAFLYHGLYDVPVYSFTCKSVFTNLTPTDAYRGAGRPEATYAIERAMDALAVAVGVGPDEIRSRNFIPTEKFPYDSPAGLVFDSGNYQPTLDRAKELVDWDGRRAEQVDRRAAGSTTHLGIGISSYVEMCGLAPSRTLAALNYGAGGWESATVRILPTCKVQVVTGVTPHGQGHETCWSMIVADQLGIDPDDVEVLHSDTAISPLGMDTYGSRSLAVGGTAIWMATEQVIEKARAIAAHMLEANADDLEFAGGNFTVKGSPEKEVPLAGVAFGAFTAHDLPEGMEPNLQAQVTFDPSNFVFPFGTHIAVVEVDEATGAVELLDYAAVDDCGNQINPLIVEGQLHGGIVQGVAQALWEDASYDADGQCRAANLADYLVPSAAECIDMKLDYTVTPSPSNPMGVKGIGEAGTIASTPAVMNAVVDALRPMGITDITMPASPMTVRRAIEVATGGAS